MEPVTSYMRSEQGRPWHILTDDHLHLLLPRRRYTLCGRTMHLGWGAEVTDDGTVPKPVCATCSRVARR